jgi:hypothetical protein
MGYEFGGTPDAFVEDRETALRMPSVEVTVLDAATEQPATGLLSATGVPVDVVTTDAFGYYTFSCDSPAVWLEVTDSQGVTRWGPIASPEAAAAAATALPGLTTDVAALNAANADLYATLASHEHPQYWRAWSGTQAAYDALAVKDPGTLYVITG